MTHAMAVFGWSLVVAMALGVGVWLLCRTSWLRQRPALCHALWLLVLVKLVVPSFVSVAVLPMRIASEASARQLGAWAQTATNDVDTLASAGAGLTATPLAVQSSERMDGTLQRVPAARRFPRLTPSGWLPRILALSLGVSIALALGSLLRCRKVHRLFRGNSAESGHVAMLLGDVAALFEIRNPPRVIVVYAQLTPLLWAGPRGAAIILPRPLIDTLDDDQLRSIMAHELAHFVRRDHWSNMFAFCVTTLAWWNPMAWIARRQLSEAAELSCDAMVLERLSGSRKCYAQTLLRVVDFVTDLEPCRLATAVTFGESQSLRHRFEMLADAQVTSKVSRLGWAFVLMGAITSMLMPARAEQPVEKPTASAAAIDEASADQAKAKDAAQRSEPDAAKPTATTPEQAAAEKRSGQTVRGFGTVIDPDGDCRFKEEQDAVTIVVPNAWHDFTYTDDYSKLNAPRILQDAKGDFTLEGNVAVFDLPTGKGSSGGDHSFVSSGLLIWQDERNFIRMERAAVGDAPFVWVELFQEGKSVSQQGHELTNKDTFLRVTRKGDAFAFATSEDGKTWAQVHNEEAKLAETLKVGVLAINSTVDAFSVKIKDLKLSRAAPNNDVGQMGWPMRVRVVDGSTGQAITTPHFSVEWGAKITSSDGDASGEATLALPSRAPSFFYLRVRAPGYAPMRAFWSSRGGQPADELPESFTFAMSKAIKVGGRVIDEEGDPVAGATVFFSAGDGVALTGRRAESSFFDEEYKTDAQGRWESDLAPPNVNNGSFRVDHPDFARVSERWSVDDKIDELRSLTYTWTLHRSFNVRGRITDSAGQPVEGAVLAIGYMNSYADSGPFPKTDADGNYEFSRVGAQLGLFQNADPRLTITAMKVGFAPVMQRIGGWEPAARPVERYVDRNIDFVFQPGRTVRIRVVDSAGQPVAGMRVFPDDWNETRPFMVLAKFGLPQKTVENGVWEWTWAPPDDELKYDLYGKDYMDVRDYPIAATQAENEVRITLKRPQQLTGRVINATTKRPIESFVVQKGFEGFKDKPDGVYWDLSTDTRGRDGQYIKPITMPPHNGSYRYRVLAEGYAPRISESVKFEEGEVTLDFEIMPISK